MNLASFTILASVFGALIGFCGTRAFFNLASRKSDCIREVFKGADVIDAIVGFILPILAATTVSRDVVATPLSCVIVTSTAALIGAFALPFAVSIFLGTQSLSKVLRRVIDRIAPPPRAE